MLERVSVLAAPGTRAELLFAMRGTQNRCCEGRVKPFDGVPILKRQRLPSRPDVWGRRARVLREPAEYVCGAYMCE